MPPPCQVRSGEPAARQPVFGTPSPTPLQVHSLVCVVTARLNSLSPGRLLGPFFLLGEMGFSDVQLCSSGAQTRWCLLEVVVADPSVGWTASSPDPRVLVPGSLSTLVHLGLEGPGATPACPHPQPRQGLPAPD